MTLFEASNLGDLLKMIERFTGQSLTLREISDNSWSVHGGFGIIEKFKVTFENDKYKFIEIKKES